MNMGVIVQSLITGIIPSVVVYLFKRSIDRRDAEDRKDKERKEKEAREKEKQALDREQLLYELILRSINLSSVLGQGLKKLKGEDGKPLVNGNLESALQEVEEVKKLQRKAMEQAYLRSFHSS